MYNSNECGQFLATVRSHEPAGQQGKLLFTLVDSQCGVAILMKRKGEAETYCIPLFVLLQPFVSDVEALKRCTRYDAYREGIMENRCYSPERVL